MRVLDRVDRRLRQLPAGARVRIACEQIRQLRALNRQIDQLHGELAELVAARHPDLLAEQGCGALTAAILIGHTAGNQRFRKEANFAMNGGPSGLLPGPLPPLQPALKDQATAPHLT